MEHQPFIGHSGIRGPYISFATVSRLWYERGLRLKAYRVLVVAPASSFSFLPPEERQRRKLHDAIVFATNWRAAADTLRWIDQAYGMSFRAPLAWCEAVYLGEVTPRHPQYPHNPETDLNRLPLYDRPVYSVSVGEAEALAWAYRRTS